jgi:HEAT repeat protein
MLCEYYGESIVSPLLDLLGRDESPSVRKFLTVVLVRLGEKVHKECLRRLADKRWYMRRNILHILGEIGDREMVRKAKPFCRDRDPRVRAEAARCLLMVGDDLGVATLKEMIQSERGDEAELAIVQAGAAKVRELVPDLLEKLKRPALRGSDYKRRIYVVRALRHIGDSRAERAIQEILQMHSLLYRKDLKKLKDEAGKALPHLAGEQ